MGCSASCKPICGNAGQDYAVDIHAEPSEGEADENPAELDQDQLADGLGVLMFEECFKKMCGIHNNVDIKCIYCIYIYTYIIYEWLEMNVQLIMSNEKIYMHVYMKMVQLKLLGVTHLRNPQTVKGT